MKIIICGAGQVGSQIARHLSRERNDVTIIDQDSGLVRRVTDSFDVNGVVGFASHPDVLERAGAQPTGFVSTDYSLAVWGLKDIGEMLASGALDLKALFGGASMGMA